MESCHFFQNLKEVKLSDPHRTAQSTGEEAQLAARMTGLLREFEVRFRISWEKIDGLRLVASYW